MEPTSIDDIFWKLFLYAGVLLLCFTAHVLLERIRHYKDNLPEDENEELNDIFIIEQRIIPLKHIRIPQLQRYDAYQRLDPEWYELYDSEDSGYQTCYY